jgi:hypothetical protein
MRSYSFLILYSRLGNPTAKDFLLGVRKRAAQTSGGYQTHFFKLTPQTKNPRHLAVWAIVFSALIRLYDQIWNATELKPKSKCCAEAEPIGMFSLRF